MKKMHAPSWAAARATLFSLFLLGLVAAGLVSGCASQAAWKGISPRSGPALSRAGIPATASPETKMLIGQLYGEAQDAANAIVSLCRNKEIEAVPFIVSMMEDVRLVELRDDEVFRTYRPVYPVGYVAARYLGLFGEDSVMPVIGYLEKNHAYFYLRGNAAAALSSCVNSDRDVPGLFRSLKGTGHSLTLIHALESCTEMSTNPMNLPAVARNPHYSLSTGERGGILVLLRIIGMTGDTRALPVLNRIVQDAHFRESEKAGAKDAVSEIEAQ